VAAWLVLIAVAVTMTEYYDIAVRDLVLAVGRRYGGVQVAPIELSKRSSAA
jgi:hypothetical protein